MKFRPTDKARGMVVELGSRETQLPSVTAGRALPVFRLTKILVPVDFSDCSKKALQYAIPLAEQFDAELTLLHVIPPSPPILELGLLDVVTLSLDEARDKLEALKRQVSSRVPARAMLRVLRQGELYAEIIQVAKELGIDLIVLATHGRKGLARVFLGSTAEKVVRYAGCPVLVVREHEHEFVAEKNIGLEEGALRRTLVRGLQ